MNARKLGLPVLGATAAAAALALGVTLGPGTAGAQTAGAAPTHGYPTHPTVSVFATGLNVPKYPTYHQDRLYVPESGTGGKQCVPLVGISGQPTTACVGATGAVVDIDRAGHVHPAVRGLASSDETDIHEVEGPIAVTFENDHPVVLTRGAYVGPTGESSLPGPLGRQFGKLLMPTSSGVRTMADLSAFVARHPQDPATMGGLPGELTYDSDVHDITPYRGGHAIADAGANSVLWHSPAGTLSVLARFPTQAEHVPAGALGPGSPATTIQAQAVPSSVTVGPDGALYVGILRGVPGLPGTAAVYRVTPGATPVPVVTGLSRVSDVAFDRSGRLLILEANVGGRLAPPTSPGALLRATPHGNHRVNAHSLGVKGLIAPTGMAVGPKGEVYVTNNTATPGHGQVLKVTNLG